MGLATKLLGGVYWSIGFSTNFRSLILVEVRCSNSASVSSELSLFSASIPPYTPSTIDLCLIFLENIPLECSSIKGSMALLPLLNRNPKVALLYSG